MPRYKKIVLDKKQVETVEKLARLHITAEEIADFLEIDRATFFRVKKRQPEVAAAFEKGKTSLKIAAMNTLAKKIQQEDLTATIFYLKTKCGFREKSDIDISNSDGSLKPNVIKLVAGVAKNEKAKDEKK